MVFEEAVDTIIIHFKGLEPQEARVKARSGPVVAWQFGEWCYVGSPYGFPFVKFKAQLEYWERRNHEALA